MSIWTALAGNSGLFSGGLGLLGGIFGSKQEDRRRHEEYARQDTQLQRLVKDAEAAGLSPLAALGSSAAGSFATPVGSTNTGSWLSDSLSDIGSGVEGAIKSKSPEAKLGLENASLKNDLLRAKIDAINSDTVNQARLASTRPTEAGVAQNRAYDEPMWLRVYDQRSNTYTWTMNPRIGMDPAELAATSGQTGVNKDNKTIRNRAPTQPRFSYDPYFNFERGPDRIPRE